MAPPEGRGLTLAGKVCGIISAIALVAAVTGTLGALVLAGGTVQ